MATHPPISLPHSPLADQIIPLLSVCLQPTPFTISSTSMEVGSTASASNPLTSDGIPLIICTDYNRRRVVRRVSTKPWSKGEVFLCCPTHKVSVDCVPYDFLHFCCFGALILEYHFHWWWIWFPAAQWNRVPFFLLEGWVHCILGATKKRRQVGWWFSQR